MLPKFLRVASANFWGSDPKIIFMEDQLLLDVVADALGFTYKCVFAPDGRGFGERLPNGTWTKALGMMQRREADLLIGNLVVTREIHDEFRLSYPFAVDEVTFVTKKPEPNPISNAIFLHPFSIQVWISIIACIFLVAFQFQCLLRRRHSAIKFLTSTLSTLVAQGIELTPRRLREYFVLGSWILGSSLLYYFYVAVLLSFLMVPSMEGIKTIDDLAKGIKNGKYECESLNNAVYSSVLSNQQNSSAQVIWNELAQKLGTLFFTDYLEDGNAERKRAVVGRRSEIFPYKDFYFISEENFFSTFLAFATHKEFCCGPELDEVIHRFWSSKIFEKVSADMRFYEISEDLRVHGEKWGNPPSDEQLTMAHLKGAFIFLNVSHSLAFLVFLIEVCLGKFKRRKIASKG